MAMIIAHELMHIYFHYVTHLDKTLQDLDCEEGLCELVGFYVGLYIRYKGEKGIYSADTKKMLEIFDEEDLTETELDRYRKYNKFFIEAYNNFNKYNDNLLNFFNNILINKGL